MNLRCVEGAYADWRRSDVRPIPSAIIFRRCRDISSRPAIPQIIEIPVSVSDTRPWP